jgi:phosphatidylglycerophosphatase A
LDNLSKCIATFFGAGYAPVAPGTVGAICAFMVSYGLSYISLSHSMMIHFILIIVFYFLGVWATNHVSKDWGSDPSKVVVDEAIGFWITILPFEPNFMNLCLALLLFRIFDIWKPLGIRKIDEISHSGHAVMLDDVAAGLVACFVLFILLKLI